MNQDAKLSVKGHHSGEKRKKEGMIEKEGRGVIAMVEEKGSI